MIDVVIITGVSGSGKSSTLYTFEEAGYYVVDNIPLDVAKPLFETIASNRKYKKVAIAIPLENANDFYKLAKNYKDFNLHFLGLTCSKEALNERFRLSRKRHPLQSKGYTYLKQLN